MGKRRANIPKQPLSGPKRTVQSDIKPSDTDAPKFILSNEKWMDGVRVDHEMTTCLKDQEQFANKSANIMTKLLPKMMQDWKTIFKNPNGKNKHCHELEGKALDRAKKVIAAIYGDRVDYEAEHLQRIWQFGFGQGVRLVCGITDSTDVFPLFVDYHHLLSPDKNFNQQDFMRYRYCPRRQSEHEDPYEEVAVTISEDAFISKDDMYRKADDLCESCSEKILDFINT